jgi:hypothetical protein
MRYELNVSTYYNLDLFQSTKVQHLWTQKLNISLKLVRRKLQLRRHTQPNFPVTVESESISSHLKLVCRFVEISGSAVRVGYLT